MKHSSSPAYTIGKKYPAEPDTTNKHSPSPLAYNTRDYEINVPSSIFSRGPRSISSSKPFAPGPGAYKITSFVDQLLSPHKGKRRHAFKDKGDKILPVSPGPGSYNPNRPIPKISYSMGNKTYALGSSEDSTSIGPGHYSPEFKSVDPNKSVSFYKSDRYRANFDASPGPCDYEPLKSFHSPIHEFSRQLKKIDHLSSVPGPNTYTLPSFADEARQKPGVTLKPRREAKKINDWVPGPGAFETGQKESGPRYSIGKGKRSKLNFEESSPGPGQYSPEPKSSIGKSFEKSERKIAAFNKVPGPGSYELKSFLKEGPQYSLIGRKEVTDVNLGAPGPGKYEPDFFLPKAKSFHATIGRGGKGIERSKGVTPGPGAYSLESKSPVPSYSFHKSPKSPDQLYDEPGPGHYEIPSTIPDIPKYVKLVKPKKA